MAIMEIPNTYCAHIYFNDGTKAEHLSWIKKMWNHSFLSHLLKRTKSANLCHANCFTPKAGFMQYGQIVYHNIEMPRANSDHCLEIIDSKEKVIQFLNENMKYLKDCTVFHFDINQLKPVQNDD
jgi:PII-like signaling protein